MPYKEAGVLCVPCLGFPPNYDKGRSAVRYAGLARTVILKLKHGDATYLTPSLSNWMRQAGKDLWQDTDYLIPVPLHRWRLLQRRYNQATLLAKGVSNLVGIPVLSQVLIREKSTESQGRKTRHQRLSNVQGAFAIKDPRDLLKGKTVTLIDDVWTTGATLETCVKVLKQSGVGKVYVLTFARVIHFD
jgi:ComF family protein